MTGTDINTFLFAWNPVKYPWTELAEQCEHLRAGEKIIEDWSCASHKKIRIGDRAFFSIVGVEARGLFASGHVVSEPFIGKDHRGHMNHRVRIQFDVLLDPNMQGILTLELLNMGNMAKQVWTPQASGISIKPAIVEELEALWKDFLKAESAL